MKKVYRAHTSSMSQVACDIEDFCQEQSLDMPTAFALNLCIDEIFTNIASYAYKDGEDDVIEVELLRDGDFIKTYIRDNGKPFNPLTEAKEPDLNAALAERDIGGLGIFLIKKNMDELAYRRKDGFNELMLAKKIGTNDA